MVEGQWMARLRCKSWVNKRSHPKKDRLASAVLFHFFWDPRKFVPRYWARLWKKKSPLKAQAPRGLFFFSSASILSLLLFFSFLFPLLCPPPPLPSLFPSPPLFFLLFFPFPMYFLISWIYETHLFWVTTIRNFPMLAPNIVFFVYKIVSATIEYYSKVRK